MLCCVVLCCVVLCCVVLCCVVAPLQDHSGRFTQTVTQVEIWEHQVKLADGLL